MKYRIRWKPSEAEGLAGYKLYWAVDKGVDYNCDSTGLLSSTEVVLPDDIPSFPLVSAIVELGVTAINDAGNESDMTKRSAYLHFTPPKPRYAPQANIIQFPYDIRL